MIARSKRNYLKGECVGCGIDFYPYEEKDYLMELYPVDKLKPLCNFCCDMNKLNSRGIGCLYVFTKTDK